MKDRTQKVLQPNESVCCAQPVDGAACCNKEAGSDDCCVQPFDSSSCC